MCIIHPHAGTRERRLRDPSPEAMIHSCYRAILRLSFYPKPYRLPWSRRRLTLHSEPFTDSQRPFANSLGIRRHGKLEAAFGSLPKRRNRAPPRLMGIARHDSSIL
jgi:hypothetical protein